MTTHPKAETIARYADRHAVLDEVTVWSVEAHLEGCPACRALLAEHLPGPGLDLLARIGTDIDAVVAAAPAPPRWHRFWAVQHRWFVWHLAPWMIMTVAMLGCAVLLQTLVPALPSVVTLLAPVAPLPGVVVAWSRRHDPAWELLATTPAAGLGMLLRRTAAVLAVIVPTLALATSGTGAPLALALLPCLAFTTTTIALGTFIGVHRAAVLLGTAWTLTTLIPAMVTAGEPFLLRPATSPAWAVVTLAVAGVVALRSHHFRGLSSHH
ncbi:MAG TPA: zf-HC2 domain-containing protein [Actinoplanes sp.]|nr:zf-HC2 domain-containing protein [Actinoplanes sp.]